MSASEDAAEAGAPVEAPLSTVLTVTVRSFNGLRFLGNPGANQVSTSILFPTHGQGAMSPLVPPSDTVTFDFSRTFDITFFPHSTANVLLANPLEVFLHLCSPDMKKQHQVASVKVPFDQILLSSSCTATVDVSVLPEGASMIAAEGLTAVVDLSWSQPPMPQEVADESFVATVTVQGVTATPQAMNNCSTQPNTPGTHIFVYELFGELPDGQPIFCEDGKFTASSADCSDAAIVFNETRKVLVSPEEVEKWKEAAENGQNMKVYIQPVLNPLVSQIGIEPKSYAALFGQADLEVAQFVKPGRFRWQLLVPVVRDREYTEHKPVMPLTSPDGLPPEPVPETSAKGKKPPWKRANVSSRGTAKSKAAASPAKKQKVLSAKDKKIVGHIQSVLTLEEDRDYFEEATTSLKIEISFSRPMIPRPPTPASSKTAEEIVQPLPNVHEKRLANATEEYCRQLDVAIERMKAALEKGEKLDAMKKLITEEMKPSIVQIVQQVFASDDDEGKKVTPKITDAFIAELRSFLMANLYKTLNTKYDLAYPRPPPVPQEMDLEHITQRIENQSYHRTDDIEALYLRRCELDPRNAKWAFELAIYYNDQQSPKALEWFAKAASIDYSFMPAVLGFCAQLTKAGNKEDTIVLLNMLNEKHPNDPTVMVCLSILYQLMESSKTDQLMAKIAQMGGSGSTSPNIIAATSLLDVHDTFLSEMILTREQMTGNQSKELLVLQARFAELNHNFSRAQEYLRQAIEADREDLSVFKMLGNFQYEAGDLDKARETFEQLLYFVPEPDPEVCVKLALIYLNSGLYEKAYHILMTAVQKKDSSLAWACLGVCCIRLGDYEEADVCLTHANELDKWDATTWGYCAVLCAKTDRTIEGNQAVCWAANQHLRDYRLIQEILSLYNSPTNPETISHIQLLAAVQESDCHKPLENTSHHQEEEESM